MLEMLNELNVCLGSCYTTYMGIIWLVLILAIWTLVWKGLALWKCGRNKQIVWFVLILILNTLGILPIVYLVFFQKKTKVKRKKKR